MQRQRRRRSKRIWYVILGVFIAVFLFSFLAQRFKNDSEVDAASTAGFDPGYIISDYQMGNYNSMSEADIQRFLTSKNSCPNTNYNYYLSLSANGKYTWHWANGHFVCLSEERFGDGEVIGSGDTAAHIIWQAAQDYRINPQVLIVLLQKETSLITDPIPNNGDYRKATGYGCPDTAPCSSQYYGFKNQVRKAAALFRTVLDGGWTNYPLGNNYVQYNPNAACGGSVVNIRSLATSALYRYTPYQPNAGALAAGYGTAYCGAYGNRNFYLYFEDWFGGITKGKSLLEAESKIEEAINGGINAGSKISVNYINGTQNVYALYENGVFYVKGDGSPVFIKTGEIRDLYRAYKLEDGLLGYPISNEKGGLKDGAVYQLFEGGVMYWHPRLGTHVVFNGATRDLYRSYGLENGKLGYPISDEQFGLKENATYQLFENAVVYTHPEVGTHSVVSGVIRNLYRSYGLENGEFGYPISEEKDGEQEFQNRVIGLGKVYTKKIYNAMKGKNYGKAMRDVGCGLRNNGCYQVFEKGIVYESEKGVFIVEDGKMLDEFRVRGREGGIGYPISEKIGNRQEFENGIISY